MLNATAQPFLTFLSLSLSFPKSLENKAETTPESTKTQFVTVLQEIRFPLICRSVLASASTCFVYMGML
ncbi:hypothetical protein HRI_003059100 [Hibiscus trionum]|uniref:Uncharacterized protein n=1 Tax=Hibiscus trionum TaxID=183268 RepID=A0A9W7IEF4_HIBTR|nr:hypothetical protein HRI_003059100 [Hibiscus trionum]